MFCMDIYNFELDYDLLKKKYIYTYKRMYIFVIDKMNSVCLYIYIFSLFIHIKKLDYEEFNPLLA